MSRRRGSHGREKVDAEALAGEAEEDDHFGETGLFDGPSSSPIEKGEVLAIAAYGEGQSARAISLVKSLELV